MTDDSPVPDRPGKPVASRRAVLHGSLASLAAATLPAPLRAQQAPGFVLADPQPFQSDTVLALARDLAKKPFAAPNADLPAPFNGLSAQQYAAIHARREAAVWVSERTGFVLELLQRGFVYAVPIELRLVEAKTSRRLVYNASAFDFGALKVPANTPDIGFSGFRVHQQDGKSDETELAIFQGPCFLRALARGQNLGALARALSIRTAEPRGEEVPQFRTMFIEKPSLAANLLVVHALLDSPSLTGACRFTIRLGEATIVDTEMTLFPRAALEAFGLGTMQASFLQGAIDHRRQDDVRPNVGEVQGLQFLNGNGEWIWRPVSNRETLQVSSFLGDNPRGFGLLQRERNFAAYEDDVQHWERRPSLWVQPIDDWGQGAVSLVEIPSNAEINDNVIAFWQPKQPLAPGSETRYAFRQFWCWSAPDRPPLSEVRTSLSGHGSSARRRRFIVEFAGPVFGDAKRASQAKPLLSVAPGTIVASSFHWMEPEKAFRVDFEIEHANNDYAEIRLVIDSAGIPISETWLYRWTP